MIDQGLQFYDAVKEARFDEANLYDPNAPLSDKLITMELHSRAIPLMHLENLKK